jgi:hypothetical protein
MNDTATKSPQEKAWDTARQQAREKGRTVRDEEIRCIKSKALGPWAKLLFWILSKICWESSDFLHNQRPGAVCITGPQLKKYYGFPTKRLYPQTRKGKDKSGNVTATRVTPGAIEQLTAQGFIWVSRKQVRNIPAAKWPNVFNIAQLVPQHHQPGLGLLEDVVVVEDLELERGVYSNGGVSDFSSQNERGSSQTPENALAKGGTRPLAYTNGGSSQAPRAALAKYPRGVLPSTPVGVTPDTNGGVSQDPPVVQAKSRARGLARAAIGIPLKTSDPNLTLRPNDGGSPSPDRQFQDWLKTLPGMFPSQLRRTEKDLSAKLQKAQSPEARTEWQRRLVAVRLQLLGGPVEDKPKATRPVQVEKKPEMTPEQLKAAWKKEQAALAIILKQKSVNETKARIAADAKARWSKMPPARAART